MRARLLLLLCFCVLALSLAPAVASADKPRVAVVAVDITGDAAPELRDQAQLAVLKGIAAANRDPVTFDMVRTATEFRPELVGCTSTTCLESLSELVNADRFIRAHIEASGATYSVEIELLDAAADGGLLRRRKASCAVCTVTDLGESIANETVAVLDDNAPDESQLRLSSDPPGATVLLGDRALGTTPMVATLPAGEHTLRAELEGYMPAERRVTVIAGTSADLAFQLALTSRPSVATPPDKASPLKWVALGGAGLLLIAGAILAAIDGNESCGDSAAHCPEKYETLLPGLLSIGAGIGLGAAGGWLWYRESRESSRAVAGGLAPTRGGAVARVALTF